MRIDLYGKVKMNDNCIIQSHRRSSVYYHRYKCRSGGNRGWNTRTYTYMD